MVSAAHSVVVMYASDYGFSDRLSQVGCCGVVAAQRCGTALMEVLGGVVQAALCYFCWQGCFQH